MPATRNSKKRPTSKPGGWPATIAAALLLAIISVIAAWWHYSHGYALYYGDAEAHLNTARRIADSRTPGPEQLGTPWLPLPHLLMMPFVASDRLWQTGLAGVIPSVACFILAGVFFFAALRRIFESAAAAFAGALLFALNPNALYLQATPMTEPIFFAALAALLYFTVGFRQTQSWWMVAGAAAAITAATMTRYEGWFLIPFVALYFLWAAKRRRLLVAAAFAIVAGLWPIAWLAHNWWYTGNAIEFYNGFYSHKGIYQRALDQGMARAPGDQDWRLAWMYYRSAVQLVAGWPLLALAGIGVIGAVARRSFWPLLLLALGPAFYVWSMHSGGSPIFMPHLWPRSYYNTRYGLAALPLLAVLAAAAVALLPGRWKTYAAGIAIGIGVLPWLLYPRAEGWICWKESQVNSIARRDWTAQTAEYLRGRYRLGDGILMSFGDTTGILRAAGIPLRENLHEGNHPFWLNAVGRPEFHLRETWAVALSGDAVSTAMLKLRRGPVRYRCVKIIEVKGAPPVEIYRRDNPLPATPRT